MALVSRFPSLGDMTAKKERSETSNKIFPKVFETKNKKVHYNVNEPSRPHINISQVEFLLNKDSNSDENCDYHDFFMKNYHKIFTLDEASSSKANKPEKKNPVLAIEDTKKTKTNHSLVKIDMSSDSDDSDDESNAKKVDVASSHDIGLHIKQMKRNKSAQNTDTISQDNNKLIRRLRKLLRKFPFERNEVENKEIFSILYTFKDFRNMFPPGTTEKLMERFCGYATLEIVPEAETPVFGSFGYYFILKGSVRTMSVPHLKTFSVTIPSKPSGNGTSNARHETPEPLSPWNLGPGDCFGTITEINREITTKMLRVMTEENSCEFLKLSIEGYKKINKKLVSEESMEKFDVIKNCKAYSSWPKHAIEELLNVFEWRSYAPNTILASEGYRCPFIGFTVKGVCHVLRKVDIKVFDKKRKCEVKKMKQVVVGKIKEHESFGEKSVTMSEQMSCTIVTETECTMGIIPCDRIMDLDNITVRLLLQTDNASFAMLSQDQLHKKFIEQEKKKEWKEYKNSVVSNVIDKYGIVLGVGKHAEV